MDIPDKSELNKKRVSWRKKKKKKKMLEFWSKAQKGHLYNENLLKSLEK